MKKSLLILASEQFGYLTDAFKYCEYAANEFNITYIGWDYGLPKFEVPGVKVIYISRGPSLPVRNFNFLKRFHKEVQRGYDLVFVTNKIGVSIIKMLNPNANFILDIRTLSVSANRIVRFINDLFLGFETLFFKQISVISEGVARKLRLKNYHLLPLGGECFTLESKSFEKLSFLYVGTLENRNMIDCVKGFHLYLNSFESYDSAPVFTIIGDAPGNELEEIREYVHAHSLDKNIIPVGAVPHNQLAPYFEDANIGITYVPLYSYYEHQPSTKTFEYLNSGMAVIATNTYENRKIINDKTGVLVSDTAESFLNGIYEAYSKRNIFDSDYLKEACAQFTWERVVKDKFIALMNELC